MSRSEVQQRRAPAHFSGALLEVTPMHRFQCSAWGWLCLAGVQSKCSLLLGWGPHWLLGLEFGRGSCPLCTEVSLWGRVPGRPGQADGGRAWGRWHRLCQRCSEWCFLGLLWTSYSCALTCFLQTPCTLRGPVSKATPLCPPSSTLSDHPSGKVCAICPERPAGQGSAGALG